jgi:hypothetical protein
MIAGDLRLLTCIAHPARSCIALGCSPTTYKFMQKEINAHLSALNLAILHTVVYADIFDYPLTVNEIQRYLTGWAASVEAVSAVLQDGSLLPGRLNRVGEYYLLPGREQIISTRRRREQAASSLWPQALRYGRIIARLPFVRMLAVTGSLAMNNVEEGADLDYLVVTKTGRLWLCRALVLALGRLAALRGTRLCPNYLVSERSLEFPNQTLYTAHELAQMVPLSGMDIYQRMRTLNPWVKRFLPNADGAPPGLVQDSGVEPGSRAQSVLEAALLTPPASRLEKWEMERKIRKLCRENENNPEAGFSADLCKGHFNRHGQRTEHILRERLERLSLEMPQRTSPELV